MKNLITNESTSFESTLCSPHKPLQHLDPPKPKQLFFIDTAQDTKNFTYLFNTTISPIFTHEKKSPKVKIKIEKKDKIKNKNKNINDKKKHMLDFDALFKNIILQEKIKKHENKINKNNKNINKAKLKLLGSKRMRDTYNKNITSKKQKSNKRRIETKIYTNNKSKIKSSNNNSSHYDIYGINNFFSSAIKIREKSIPHNVLCPSFEELCPDFFESNNIEDYEDISDEAYLKYHNIFEKKEINYRMRVSNNLDKKKSIKELKKELVETQLEYKNLYSSENIDKANNLDIIDNNNISIKNSTSSNIIKINLTSLELEQDN